MKRDIVLTTTSELLFQIGDGSMNLFGIIFFYTLFKGSILLATLPFIALHLIHSLLLPVISPLLFKIGFKKSILIGAIFYSLACATLFLLNENLNIGVLILWASLYALGNVFHYVPIIYILGYETKHATRGRTFSLRRIIFIAGAIVMPILGGLISEYFGITGLSVLCICFYILSFIPIIYISDIEFLPGKTIFKTLFSKRGANIFLFKISQVFSDGIGTVWPIFVFLVLSSSYENVGLVFTLVSFGSIIISYLIGFELDHHNRMKLYELSAITNFFAWLARAISFNYISVLISDIIFRLNGDFRGTIMDVIDYDLMNDHIQKNRAGTIVLSEFIINMSVTVALTIGAILISISSYQLSFIVIALIGFVLSLITKRFIKRG